MVDPTPARLSLKLDGTQDLEDNNLEILKLPSDNVTLSYDVLFPNFETAFFKYLSLDETAFLSAYASMPQTKSMEPDFLNVSFEDLFNIPVDEAREAALTMVTNGQEGGVNSQERAIEYMMELWEKGHSANPFAAKSTGEGFGVGVESEAQNISESHEQTTSPESIYLPPPVIPPSEPAPSAPAPAEPFNAPDHYYIFNILNPASPTLLNPDVPTTFVIGFPPSIVAGNTSSLIDGVTPTGNDPFLVGAAPTSAGPFTLSDFASSHGQVSALNGLGGFTYVPLADAMPVADNFSFQVQNSLGETDIATTYISIVVDQNIPATFSTSGGFNFLTASGNLLTDDVAAPGATLSVLNMLNSSGVFIPVSTDTVVTISGQPIPSTTTITVSSNGDFDYESKAPTSNSAFPGGQTFTFIVGDGHGSSTEAFAFLLIPPVVLDLTGEGIHLTSAANSPITLGKLLGTENQQQIGWIEEGNAILMYDYNHNGQITNLDQISFVSYTPGAKTDLEGLAAFDTNHDQIFDINDEKYAQFGVLLPDLQFRSLEELGISSLSLESDHQEQLMGENIIHGYTTYQTIDGQSHVAADVSLSIEASPSSVELHEVIHSSAVAPAPVSDPPSVNIPLIHMPEQLIPPPETHPQV